MSLDATATTMTLPSLAVIAVENAVSELELSMPAIDMAELEN